MDTRQRWTRSVPFLSTARGLTARERQRSSFGMAADPIVVQPTLPSRCTESGP